MQIGWEAVIGIECHVELKTKSKMFCSCPNEFGGEPNTKICPVCLALPGALPVANKTAIGLMVRAGLAFGADIPVFSKFDRKNYFYPDMPKDYQISQYDMPLTQGGAVRFWLDDGTEKSCRLTRIHLEEDTGKSTHAGSTDGRIAGSSHSLIDFNRAGVPLMECVSEPDLRSAEEAVAYLEALKRTFVQLDISDVKMEEGSLRCDANVSIRPSGTTELGTKTEIKNMNSFRSVQRAIQSEILRQTEILDSGGRIIQETRGWNETDGVTHSMRNKEQAHDYRYFPDPDLVPVQLQQTFVDEIRESFPELPVDRLARYVDLRLTVAQASQLTDNVPLAEFFDACVRSSGKPQQSVNFVLGDLSKLANESGISVADSRVKPEHVAELIELVENETINSKIAKDVLARVWESGTSTKQIVEKEGLAQTSDAGAIDAFIDPVLSSNSKSIADFKAGKENALKFLMGQVMRASRGKANPVLLEARLRERILLS
ncbi:MAG: Asp-tRNA(Asn)/Glu-tRNA(Gln) amidotransferase subunit GatB [Candidatus Eremiobacteraeota bacterium]|nr:Asp-tRNA(Asn)/Glu-tRNA(Gln) amidotransferase subunit GatB [Candidatus Eremiobacteraeota bacterium]